MVSKAQFEELFQIYFPNFNAKNNFTTPDIFPDLHVLPYDHAKKLVKSFGLLNEHMDEIKWNKIRERREFYTMEGNHYHPMYIQTEDYGTNCCLEAIQRKLKLSGIYSQYYSMELPELRQTITRPEYRKQFAGERYTLTEIEKKAYDNRISDKANSAYVYRQIHLLIMRLLHHDYPFSYSLCGHWLAVHTTHNVHEYHVQANGSLKLVREYKGLQPVYQILKIYAKQSELNPKHLWSTARFQFIVQEPYIQFMPMKLADAGKSEYWHDAARGAPPERRSESPERPESPQYRQGDSPDPEPQERVAPSKWTDIVKTLPHDAAPKVVENARIAEEIVQADHAIEVSEKMIEAPQHEVKRFEQLKEEHQQVVPQQTKVADPIRRGIIERAAQRLSQATPMMFKLRGRTFSQNQLLNTILTAISMQSFNEQRALSSLMLKFEKWMSQQHALQGAGLMHSWSLQDDTPEQKQVWTDLKIFQVQLRPVLETILPNDRIQEIPFEVLADVEAAGDESPPAGESDSAHSASDASGKDTAK